MRRECTLGQKGELKMRKVNSKLLTAVVETGHWEDPSASVRVTDVGT